MPAFDYFKLFISFSLFIPSVLERIRNMKLLTVKICAYRIDCMYLIMRNRKDILIIIGVLL